MSIKQKAEVRDVYDSFPHKIEIEQAGQGVGLRPHRTGCMTNPSGAPVWLEFKAGEPILYVWSDINNEEPTHVISLKGAIVEDYDDDFDNLQEV